MKQNIKFAGKVVGCIILAFWAMGFQAGFLEGLKRGDGDILASSCVGTPNSWAAATNLGWLAACKLTEPWEER